MLDNCCNYPITIQKHLDFHFHIMNKLYVLYTAYTYMFLLYCIFTHAVAGFMYANINCYTFLARA